uniref:CLIP domain-containing serine protease n=2 Tax=Nyssomyia neivai TaxID=330878 RepID=A0A1L8DQG0_9DIPT
MSVKIKYFCGVILLWINLVNGQDTTSCTLPGGGSGVCVNLEECKELYEIITNAHEKKQPLSDDDKKFLREHQCGPNIRKITVCCEVQINSNFGQVSNLLPSPEQGNCGADLSERIHGGNKTKIDEFPWMALLQYKKPGNRLGFHCGGVLINNRYVLTASHCVNGKDIPKTWTLYQVRLGEHDISMEPDCEGDDCAPTPIDILIAQKIPHLDYIPESKNQKHDIALLRLSQTVQFNDFIKPICLPTAPHLRSSDFVGKPMDVAGWGRTELGRMSDVKLKVRVKGVDRDTCNSIYSQRNLVIEKGQLCAGGEKGKDSCKGDSGGPMVALDQGRKPYWYCVGLVSFGLSCGLEGWPGVYTEVTHYIDWISENIRP